MSHTVHTEMNYTAAFLMSGSFNNVSCCQFKLLLGLVGSFESAQREHHEEIFLLIWFLLFSVSFWYLLCFFTLRHTCHSLAGRLKRFNPSVPNKGKGKSLSPWILIQIDHRLKTHTLECTHTLSLHTHAPPGKRGQFTLSFQGILTHFGN